MDLCFCGAYDMDNINRLSEVNTLSGLSMFKDVCIVYELLEIFQTTVNISPFGFDVDAASPLKRAAMDIFQHLTNM